MAISAARSMGLNGPCDFTSDFTTIGTEDVAAAGSGVLETGDGVAAGCAGARPISCKTCCVNACCCCNICSRIEFGMLPLPKFPAATVCGIVPAADADADAGAGVAAGAKAPGGNVSLRGW